MLFPRLFAQTITKKRKMVPSIASQLLRRNIENMPLKSHMTVSNKFRKWSLFMPTCISTAKCSDKTYMITKLFLRKPQIKTYSMTLPYSLCFWHGWHTWVCLGFPWSPDQMVKYMLSWGCGYNTNTHIQLLLHFASQYYYRKYWYKITKHKLMQINSLTRMIIIICMHQCNYFTLTHLFPPRESCNNLVSLESL